MSVQPRQDTTIDGFDEAAAAALFASDARFNLRCQFASLVIDTFLAGVLLMQVITYFTYQRHDKWWTKLIVIWTSLWCFTITCYYWTYISYLFVDNFGLWLPWLEVRWLAKMPIFDALTTVAVQGFFAYRAFLLTKRNWFILIVLICLLCAAFGGALGVTIVFGSQASLLGATASGPTLITWNATTSAADVLIAGCILWGLLRSKSGWAKTDRLVTRLIRLTFEAQLPPTCLALAYVIEWTQTPSSLLGAVFQSLQSKAYTVGLMFTLNARINFTAQTSDTVTTNAPQVFGMNSRVGRPTQLQVNVETETYIHGDTYALGNGNKKVDMSKIDADRMDKADSLDDIETLPAINGSKARLTGPESYV